MDPECFRQWQPVADRVCARCFADEDIQLFIKRQHGPRGCGFCGRKDASTLCLGEVAEFINQRLLTFYGKAVDQLPFESAEGGYLGGQQIDTYDLLFGRVGLELPRDDDSLARALADEIGDDVWCEYDWLVLEPDESLKFSWDRFCSVVKHKRRFFFQNLGVGTSSDPDTRSPLQFLEKVCSIIERQGLIRVRAAGHRFYRARPRKLRERHITPGSLGPPPPEFATQANRMNPPGISMMYGAETPGLAIAETRAEHVSIGVFKVTRDVRILDLVNMPNTPGFFSAADRMDRLTLGFLHQFAKLIVQPVPRDDRVHIDYIPTQIFSETPF